MILVDATIWVDHLHLPNLALSRRLRDQQVLSHPFVIAELVLGRMARSDAVLEDMSNLPSANIARQGLAGLGIGYVDATCWHRHG